MGSDGGSVDLGRRRIARWVEAGLAGPAWRVHQRPGRTLAVVGVCLVLAAVAASRLAFDADLVSLLPRSFRSVQDLDALEERFGGLGYLAVVGQAAPPDQLRRFAAELSPKLAALPSVRYVDHKKPVAFFEDRTLYYLELEDLQTIRDLVKKREAWERRKNNPLYVDFEGGGPPPIDLADIEAKYTGRLDQGWMRAQLGEEYYVDDERRMIVLLAKPSGMAFDLEFDKRLADDVEQLVGTVDLASYGPDFHVEYTGRYRKRPDMQALITSDLRLASMVAFCLMIVYLALHFRRLTAVGLVMAPLVVGMTWTFGFASLVFGSLNILTGFIGAILLGLGIDHGIHLLGRFELERGRTESIEEAIRRTFGNTGRAVVVAAITTMVAFAGLGLSEFSAFREFGTIAAAGMVLLVTAYTLCLPALLRLMSGFGWRPRPVEAAPVSSWSRLLPRRPWPFLAGFLLVLALVSSRAGDASFDFDFGSLETTTLRSFVLDDEVNELLGYSQNPEVVLTRDEAEERHVATELRKRQAALGEASTIHFVAAGADLIPAQQAEKHEVLRSIHKTLRRIKPAWIPDEADRKRFVQMRHMAGMKPFSRRELPAEVHRTFLGPDGDVGEGFVLLFPAVRLQDGEATRRFAQEVRNVRLPDGRVVSAAGEMMIFSDILDMVMREYTPVMTLTLLLVFAVLWLLIGRLRTALLCLLPAVCTLLLTFGLLPLSGHQLNYMNIVMIPVLFGIGVDGGVHLVTRLLAGAGLPRVIDDTGRAISGAILTTGLGFGALLLADHHGLSSLGKLAVMGLSANLLACLVGLPAILAIPALRRLGLGAESTSPEVPLD